MHDASATDQSLASLEPIVDPESLQDVEGVHYEAETDVVDAETVAQLADLPDLAGVGIVDPDGDLLLRRATDTCSWKIPVAKAAPGDDFATAIREHVAETIGFDLALTAVETVLTVDVESESGDATASRAFVTFRGVPESGEYDLDGATPTDDPVHDADWFSALPEDADPIPGTEAFLD